MTGDCRSIAFDVFIAFAISILALSWGASLLLSHFHGLQINFLLAVALFFIGLAGLPVLFFWPVCIALGSDGKINIYSRLGLHRVSYDIHDQLASKGWDKPKNFLKLIFNDGKTYRFSRHSFFKLSSVYERLILVSGV